MNKRLVFAGLLVFMMTLIPGCGTIKENALKNTIQKKLIIQNIKVETLDMGEQPLIKEELQSITKETKENEKSDDTGFYYKKPEKKPSAVKIVVYKKARIMELYGDNNVIGRFKIALGGNPEGDKNKEGDGKTPEGEYYICTRNTESNFYRFLGLSYPNVEDAQRGLDSGLISSKTLKSIKASQELKKQPAWNTPLGGAVGIHGGGNASDWTLGCIALENKAVDVIWEYAKIKTPVLIYE
ncbi:MAG: L,D-transpeptidase family protein [Clostridiaceae bacterium]|nr:L,D-transpeptidase family protein [Clostridiaceae bacterium]